MILPLLTEALLLALFCKLYLSWSEADRWIIHSQEVLSKTATFQRNILEARATARSFALFGGDEYIVHLKDEMAAYRNNYAELKLLVSDNEQQVNRLVEMGRDILAIDTYLSVIKFEAEHQSNETAKLFLLTKQGEILVSQLLEELDIFSKVELEIDRIRKKNQRHRISQAAWVVSAGGALLLMITLFIGYLYQVAVKKRFEELMRSIKNYSEGKPFVRKLSGKDEVAILEQAFSLMAKNLQERSAENEAFVYGVSHDMRSPLVNLHGFSEELKLSLNEIEKINSEKDIVDASRKRLDSIITVDLQKSTKFITSAVSRLSTIIDGLLKLSRIGKVNYERTIFDPNAIIEKIILALDGSLRSRSATIESAKLPKIFCDPSAFEQIFANLLTNAVHYLDPKRPGHISIGTHDANDSDVTVLYVKDNGLGFPESFKSKIFLPFQRYHATTTVGEGIGLAVVHKIVEKLNLKIWTESLLNSGTTFFVSFPNQKLDS